MGRENPHQGGPGLPLAAFGDRPSPHMSKCGYAYDTQSISCSLPTENCTHTQHRCNSTNSHAQMPQNTMNAIHLTICTGYSIYTVYCILGWRCKTALILNILNVSRLCPDVNTYRAGQKTGPCLKVYKVLYDDVGR